VLCLIAPGDECGLLFIFEHTSPFRVSRVFGSRISGYWDSWLGRYYGLVLASRAAEKKDVDEGWVNYSSSIFRKIRKIQDHRARLLLTTPENAATPRLVMGRGASF
jgi:hypothetical protein